MTKSNRFLLTGAAIAGLLAGTGATIKASNLLTGRERFGDRAGRHQGRQEGERKARL